MRIGWYTRKIYLDDIDIEDTPECCSPIRDNQSMNKVIKKWEKDHAKCNGCFECSESLVQKEVDYDNSIIVIKVDTMVKTEELQKIHERIMKQKETGVIVLPPGLRASLAPKDIEIQIENGGDING
jgi:hypothetical protein